MHSESNHYHALTIGMHWLTLLLLIGVYALIELRGMYPKGSDPRELMKQWHFMLGLMVSVLVFARLVSRLRWRVPPITPRPPVLQRWIATVMHIALYVFLIVMPLLGWLTLSAKGRVIPFFGLDLPALISVDKPLANNLEDIHALIGTAGYYLIGLHAAAALFHQYFLRDDTLRRMLPRHTRN